jgi:hypothetical protein
LEKETTMEALKDMWPFGSSKTEEKASSPESPPVPTETNETPAAVQAPVIASNVEKPVDESALRPTPSVFENAAVATENAAENAAVVTENAAVAAENAAVVTENAAVAVAAQNAAENAAVAAEDAAVVEKNTTLEDVNIANAAADEASTAAEDALNSAEKARELVDDAHDVTVAQRGGGAVVDSLVKAGHQLQETALAFQQAANKHLHAGAIMASVTGGYDDEFKLDEDSDDEAPGVLAAQVHGSSQLDDEEEEEDEYQQDYEHYGGSHDHLSLCLAEVLKTSSDGTNIADILADIAESLRQGVKLLKQKSKKH